MSPVTPLHPAVAQVTMLVGLAVGVDYAMFYSRRMVEEQDKGRSSEAALDVASATSGRAVVISGLTVMAAMAGMFFAGNPVFVSFGIGTIIVVGVAVRRVGHRAAGAAVVPRPEGLAGEGSRAVGAKRRHRTAASRASGARSSTACWPGR